jgi:Circularly permutated YpsA SLOG family
MAVIKIISGGQTGVDQGALFAAAALNIKTGGWMPKNFKTEDGMRYDLAAQFYLVENSSGQYGPRTQANVATADGTLLIGDVRSPGSRLTIKFASRLNKPYYIIGWSLRNLKPLECHYYKLHQWLMQYNITVLNVAGNRESKNPGIFNVTYHFLIGALTYHHQQEQKDDKTQRKTTRSSPIISQDTIQFSP